ncbi:MAG: DUF3553 domain-containing protein [Paracoccaceae bacterium]|nr:DUF3553 domain-containing protein [Paracoccaceae bacterium]
MSHGFLEVGAIVRHAHRPEWGQGQVQSIIGARITVNFEHSGKVVLHGEDIPLELITLDDL